MKKCILILMLSVCLGSLQAVGLCEDKAFTISASSLDGTSVGELLEQLSFECGYSMLVRDKAAKNKLSGSIASVNIVELPLEKIFDLLLTENELNYEFDGKLLRVSYLTTETFKINYIGTSRVGASNTDIILSQNSLTSDSSGGSGSSSGSGLSPTDSATLQSGVHGGIVNSAMSGGSADSISGTKIYSVDEFDFWGRVEKEVFEIAFRPGDAHQPKRSSSTNTNSSSDKNTNDTEDIGDGESVIVNKAAGLITVTGTIKQLERVRKYLKELEEQMQNQVLIDVTILNVTHTNGNTVGVDWNQLYNAGNFVMPNQQQDGGEGNPVLELGGYRLFSAGFSLNRIIEFLTTYGTVRSISNPKVLTLNNQPALISVGSILRYSQSSTYLTATSGTSSTTSNEDYPSIFAGVLLDVTPSIQGEYIMLKINPSITSTKDATVENQATALAEPPNLNASQLSSLVRAKDGDKIIIGGLIGKSATNTKSRVPLLGYIPIVKYLFSYDSMVEEVNEMVIVITPHIVKRNDNPSLQDLGYTETVNEIIRKDDIKANIHEIGEE